MMLLKSFAQIVYLVFMPIQQVHLKWVCKRVQSVGSKYLLNPNAKQLAQSQIMSMVSTFDSISMFL